MDPRSRLESWPVYRQLAQRDRLGLGATVKSERSARLEPRVRTADKVFKSVCPYCAVGCGQEVYVEDGHVTQIEGDPDSPVSRGRLCPKGSASLQLTTGDARQYRVRYRRPFGSEWEDLDLDTAMDMIADRVIASAATRVAVGGRRGSDAPDPRRRQPRGGDSGQRRELPDEEAVHRARRDPDREPGAHMTLRHGPRSGDQLRARRGDRLPTGPAER